MKKSKQNTKKIKKAIRVHRENSSRQLKELLYKRSDLLETIQKIDPNFYL